MHKIPECDRCHFYSYNYHLICVPHPYGPDGDNCPDFQPDFSAQTKHFKDELGLQRRGSNNNEPFHNSCETPHNEPLWEPEGASYYAGELILQPRRRWTPEEQLQLLDTHPLFTGCCPQCGAEFERDYRAVVH